MLPGTWDLIMDMTCERPLSLSHLFWSRAWPVTSQTYGLSSESQGLRKRLRNEQKGDSAGQQPGEAGICSADLFSPSALSPGGLVNTLPPWRRPWWSLSLPFLSEFLISAAILQTAATAWVHPALLSCSPSLDSYIWKYDVALLFQVGLHWWLRQ